GHPAGAGGPVLWRPHLPRPRPGRPCLDLRPDGPRRRARGSGEGERPHNQGMGVKPDAALDRTLAALADPHRRHVVDLLRERPRRAGELAAATGLRPPAMSRHLRTLRQSGLIEESHPEFDARVRIYSLRPEPMATVKRWLEETEQLWSAQLLAFKAHLEGKG